MTLDTATKSLYARNKVDCTNITKGHARLMPGYFARQGVIHERRTLSALTALEDDIAALVEVELNQWRGAYTVLTHDTDCDGTSWQAHRVEWAASEADAIRQFQAGPRAGAYWFDGALPEHEFMNSDSFQNLPDWSKGYYSGRGYVCLGTTWS